MSIMKNRKNLEMLRTKELELLKLKEEKEIIHDKIRIIKSDAIIGIYTKKDENGKKLYNNEKLREENVYKYLVNNSLYDKLKMKYRLIVYKIKLCEIDIKWYEYNVKYDLLGEIK